MAPNFGERFSRKDIIAISSIPPPQNIRCFQSVPQNPLPPRFGEISCENLLPARGPRVFIFNSTPENGATFLGIFQGGAPKLVIPPTHMGVENDFLPGGFMPEINFSLGPAKDKAVFPRGGMGKNQKAFKRSLIRDIPPKDPLLTLGGIHRSCHDITS
ncbi:MAG: hypothetical protein CM15mP2_4520 [Methanobacteriota archaeon]|nr:MAG: hypothetical protein CM15mP2_4520 [Euryarchaeota archaeon]